AGIGLRRLVGVIHLLRRRLGLGRRHGFGFDSRILRLGLHGRRSLRRRRRGLLGRCLDRCLAGCHRRGLGRGRFGILGWGGLGRGGLAIGRILALGRVVFRG